MSTSIRKKTKSAFDQMAEKAGPLPTAVLAQTYLERPISTQAEGVARALLGELSADDDGRRARLARAVEQLVVADRKMHEAAPPAKRRSHG